MVTAEEPMVVHTDQFRYFSDIILGSGAQSTFRLDMNLNVVSLKNIRFCMRPYLYQDLIYPSYGHRMRNFLSSWNFQYGSSYLPEIAGITTRALTVPTSRRGYTIWGGATGSQAGWANAAGYNQSYMEVLKTVDNTLVSNINQSEYMIDTNANPGTSDFNGPLSTNVPIQLQFKATICGKFLAGLDTRLSKKSTVSGIDTNGLLVSINGFFDRNNISSMNQAILDVWANYDAFVQIIPGVATTVTF